MKDNIIIPIAIIFTSGGILFGGLALIPATPFTKKNRSLATMLIGLPLLFWGTRITIPLIKAQLLINLVKVAASTLKTRNY